MSNINPNAKIYVILADSVYWDVHYGENDGVLDQANSNWTPVPTGWELVKQETNSGGSLIENGFTARAYKNGNFS